MSINSNEVPERLPERVNLEPDDAPAFATPDLINIDFDFQSEGPEPTRGAGQNTPKWQQRQ